MEKRKKTKISRTKKQVKSKSKAIVVARSQPPAPVPSGSLLPSIKATIENMETMRRFVSNCLNVDLKRELAKLAKDTTMDPQARAKKEMELRDKLETDWGTIPGVDKPFLKQPGAEKILLWLNLRPKFFTREMEIKRDNADGHIEVISHVIVYTKKSNEEAFEGPDCSCTTMESNFRFRFAKRAVKPPQEDADKLKAAGLGKWVKESQWVKGVKQPPEWVWYDRIENPNIWNERNKVRQIGEKRALVKATRNMGALSEIFVSDPSEWETLDLIEEEGDPQNDQDFTPSGRRIYDEDGVSPSGRHKTYEAEKREQKEASAAKGREILEQKGVAMELEIYWADPQKLVAQLRGAALAFLLDDIKKVAKIEWLNDTRAWVVSLIDVERVKQLCIEKKIGFKETTSPASPSPAASPAPQHGAGPVERREEGAPHTPQSGAPSSVTGIIKHVQADQTSEKKIPILRVNIGGQVLGCFQKSIWPFLEAGIGKEAVLLIKGTRRDIVGIVRIASREFDVDGKTPIIQNSEARPQHIGELFQ